MIEEKYLLCWKVWLCWTRPYMRTSDKEMFTAVVDLLSFLFEVSIYSAALYQETVLSL